MPLSVAPPPICGAPLGNVQCNDGSGQNSSNDANITSLDKLLLVHGLQQDIDLLLH